jgi:hypothetical protein
MLFLEMSSLLDITEMRDTNKTCWPEITQSPVTMPSSFDRFMPRTQLRFSDGGVLAIGNVSCDDQIQQAVLLSYTPSDSITPTMQLELPPKAVEVIIGQLQEYANQARFVNGEHLLEYPEPHRAQPPNTSQKSLKTQRSKTKKGQQDASCNHYQPPCFDDFP